MNEEAEYEITLGLNTLNNLGLNLYSNVPAVISEVVANSYDADAEVVEIKIDSNSNTITIADDGCGMTTKECNTKYLYVGYDKRGTEGRITPIHQRHVMGRKGIGKLSLFSIANTIEVQSAKKDERGILQKSGFVMDAGEIRKLIKNGDTRCPLPATKQENITVTKGTKITLRNLKKEISTIENFLRRRLARRFSIIGEMYKFKVIINGKPITVKDRDYLKKIEYLWYFGNYGNKCMKHCTNVKEKEEIDGVVDKENNYIIEGWIGTFDERKSIEEGNNAIVLLSWGKLIHEDLLKNMDEGGVYSKYLIGEIRADFLDADDQDDIATTDRQSVKEDDVRLLKLKEHVRNKILKIIQNKWTEWRKKDAETKALENEKVKEWFSSLKGDMKQHARKLFAKIESFPVSDPQYKKVLYKHGILAFETLALRQNLSVLDNIDTDKDFDTFISTLSDMDHLEALHYHEIVKNRVGVLNKFVGIVKPKTKENVLQKYVFDHLWLLDPSWERADTVNKRIEESVTSEFKGIDAKLTKEEKAARIDIRYKNAVGKHIVVELKKYDAKVDVYNLQKQINKYRTALCKCLESKLPGEDHQIEIVCILGSPPTGIEKKKINDVLKVHDARYITYDELIRNTIQGYSDYLKKEKKINEIQNIIESI